MTIQTRRVPRWLGRLRELVSAIASRFSRYFETMGFAGDVELSHGKSEVSSKATRHLL